MSCAAEGQERPFWKRIGYDALRTASRLVVVTLFRGRCRGRHRIPDRGPLLVCANHQSFLDPVLVGLAFDRRLNYLARESLFRIPGLRRLMHYLDAIPIDRDGMGMSGLRESLRRLRRGEGLVIFPEGTRTPDGEVHPLKSGFCVLARRSKAALLPVGIDGAFQAWPRNARFPRLSVIRICVGEPILREEIDALDDPSLVRELERRIRACHAAARAGRRS